MRSILIFIVVLFSNQSIMAQGLTFGDFGNTNAKVFMFPNYNGLPVETKGSPFFNNENFVEGEVRMTDTIYKKDLLFRYDQIIRTLQVKLPDGKIAYMNPENIVSFKLFIEGKTFLFERTLMNRLNTYEFLQVIYSSPTLRLLRDSRKKTRRVDTYDLYTSAPKEKIDYIENDYRYYLRVNEAQQLKQVEPNKKSFSNAFPQKAAFINELFNRKEYRIDLSVSKLAEIVKYLDEELQKEAN